MEDSLDTWFKREILAHEALLVRFICRAWRRRDERDDIRYDAYIRVYEASLKSRPHAPKAFLFSTVKNLMADRIRRERIVSIQAGGEIDHLNVLVDEISPEQRVGANQELARLAKAFDRLPQIYRDTIWLRRVNELSQKEIAAALSIAEKTVEKRLRTGSRLLAHFMRSDAGSSDAAAESDETEHEHGTHHQD